MMLTGQAKKDYQREYMRRYRSNKSKTQSVRPCKTHAVRPEPLAINPIQIKNVKLKAKHVEPQSHNPMMVGYVPPK